MSIGAAIREARESRGWSQPDLGARLGVTAETISRWETGAYEVPKRNQIALEAILGQLAAGTVKEQSKRRRPGARKPLKHKGRG